MARDYFISFFTRVPLTLFVSPLLCAVVSTRRTTAALALEDTPSTIVEMSLKCVVLNKVGLGWGVFGGKMI